MASEEQHWVYGVSGERDDLVGEGTEVEFAFQA